MSLRQLYTLTLIACVSLISTSPSAQTAAAADPARLKAGPVYELAATANSLKPISRSTCSSLSSEQLCSAPARSVFEVIRLDLSSGVAFVKFHRIGPPLGLSSTLLVDSEVTYSAAIDSLADASVVFRPFFSGTLKAVLIPTKIYTSNWQQGANPSVGVAFSFTPKRRPLDFLDFAASVEFGAGLNQISVDTANKSEERTGLSIFYGYNFRNFDDKVGLGIYLGRDFVRLKDGEQFAGAGRRHRTWLGLVLSTDVAK